jgi:hypothetical protein
MAATNPPPIRVPKKLAEDREIFAYFNELHTFLRLLWTRTGGGEDFIASLEAQNHVAVTVSDTSDVDLGLDGQLLSATLTASVHSSLGLADSAVQEADIDGLQYGRKDAGWEVIVNNGFLDGGRADSIYTAELIIQGGGA